MAQGRKQKVEQIDLETGEVIEVYKSSTEAAEDNWIVVSVFNKKMREGKGEAVFEDKQLLFRRLAN